MSTHAAFLRGINLGRHRRVTNANLRGALSRIGLGEVACFRASGNVAFAADREPEERLRRRIEAALEESLGFEVATFLRTAAEIRAIAELQPFDPELVAALGGKLQVSILRKRPPPRSREAVMALATEHDLLAFGERELYWLPSGGLLESALDVDAIERTLGATTRRTKGTIEQLAAKHFAG